MSKFRVKPSFRWSGLIKLGGEIFRFETSAVSEAEAINNGIAQYSKRVNMSIGKLRKYLKDYNATISANPFEEVSENCNER